ncbi:hypothetical protein PFMC_00049 [Plasmodium falciparum CAMP/Malaysia]|uniref:Bms1-type G domain-containing protein n=1 Tax=Plasmodium falciparum (isolate Camp / Malaysia) TaxID=5835 RepID=A0A024XFM9_PLAFC|nr:hypothetical protein PFMC_00049 [Plasmodium falciparum CAMP/Malaysia]
MDDKKKHHKKKKVGKKSKKKKINKNGNNKKYHKAFAFSGGIKSAHRRKQHLFELEEKKLRVQKVYKEGNKSSPLIVVIQGAKGVGKSTLLKSLIKYYVGITINNIKGPISIFTKNLKRYTFIEVNDDILHMIDVAKIADICILVIDGSYGIELETLEFLNILYTHGLPKVLGVVTHLDKFKDSKSIRKRKKKLNKRYSEELVEGSKLFFLSGIQNNRYNKTEIRNLCKFLSVIKKPIISWREQHGYILGLKLDVDDLLINNQITSQKNNLQSEHVHNENYVNHASYDNDNDNDEENEKKLTNFLTNCDEKIKISIEGYVYGSKIYKNQKVHIPNIGDVEIDNIQILQEPFKLDEQKKNPNIYAPMSDVGNLTFDFDNMYIHIPKNKVNFTREEFLLADQREETIPGDHSGEKNGNTLKDDDNVDDGDDDDDDVGDDNVDDDDGNDDDDDDNDDDDDDNDDDDNDDDDDDDNENSDKSSHHNKQSNDNEKYITDSIKMIRELQKSNGVFSKQQKDNLILFNETNDNNGASNIRRKAPSNVYISEKQKKKKQQDSYVNEKAEEYNKLESILYEKKNNDEEYYCANNVTISSDDDKEENDASFREFYRKYGLNADMSDDGGNNDINIYNGQESEEKLKDTYDKLIDGGDDEDDYDDDENVELKHKNTLDPNKSTVNRMEAHDIADILSFDNKISLDTFIYDFSYINRKNNLLYFRGDVINVIKREERKLDESCHLQEYEEHFYFIKNMLSTDIVEDKKRGCYSFMNEDNYYYDKLDTFRSDEEDIFIFNNLSISLYDIVDSNIVDNFFSRYDKVYRMFFKNRKRGNMGINSEGDDNNNNNSDDDNNINSDDNNNYSDDNNSNSDDNNSNSDDNNSNSDDNNSNSDDNNINSDDNNINSGDDNNLKDKDKGNIGNEINIKENLKKLKEEKLIEKEKFRETEKIGVLNSGYGSSVNIGEYVRIELNIEKKKLAILKNNLIICGGIQTYEEKDSLIHCRIKKHRWFPKLLRSNDPLIFSVGWRRYQSIPIYSISERNNVRLRYLKYTTEHMHCNCTFYGPLASVNSGILALYNYKKVPFYRICINGLIIETNNNLNIMKKLKLIGEPYKIFKNTAFVKNMFNSDLEVCKFLNCPVVTPSGIKGLIKNKINNNGDFRCTFADKIRMSDIVILKLYVNVKIKKFYYFDIENKIKSINELRYLYNIYVNHNNNYRSIPFRHFYHTKIQIKSKLLKDLPFKSKPKLFKKLQNHANLNNKQLTNNINNKKTKTDQINFNALPNPKLAAKWYQMLHTIKKNILDQKKAKSQLSYHKKLKEKLKIQQAKTQVVKQRKKISYKKGRK